ncbi:KdsC family phosphatase [Sphingobacterium psychroaquaticum]|uniref:3-deoxy-D-manno-octulosonate 8-phosphate phosphatase (KDO 8-P phosphatase) n=1 Tax=Sphingobacterium psychroaquaticum TaxID=561061 RepID=A0A1X7L893_9SPHI|nr:HAD hydrolase family protein [Sphingobacterium psychroaquaticum]SMG49960.1 3-deoxy-D-manno-octulosonate 8-phosphate phosphatase (KDO 8-P phosphatase) [Sphingobacterium psychroaquaticum]
MILKDFSRVKAVFLDVDGVLTDGTVQVTEQGEQLRTFSIKDGYAIQLAIKRGLFIAVITGGNSQGVLRRLQGLGVTEIFWGISDKEELMLKKITEYGFSLSDVVFVGDDIPDLACMKKVGIAACPHDAVEEIKQISAYISPRKGGEGCVRDILEKILKLQGKWGEDITVKSI